MNPLKRLGAAITDWWHREPIDFDAQDRAAHGRQQADIEAAVQANRAHCGARLDSKAIPGNFYICTLPPDHEGPMHECWSTVGIAFNQGPRASWPVEPAPLHDAVTAVGDKVDDDLATVTELGDLADAIRDMDTAALDYALAGLLDDEER
ncbi:hypothetical protein [Isoptericola sp. NPDC056134]|uniref:hypothetical protein n=1 Tax=Isoptericola sp. NPDC056134 TaxID=3345723 RepID=UPI0035F0B84C